MCEEMRFDIAQIPCKICVVNDCKEKGENICGCQFGKPSNEMLKWAFEYTNALRYAGIKKPF